MGKDTFCIDFVSPHPDARVIVYDLAIGLPALAFLAFLGWHLKPSLRKLRRSQSRIMATYYGFLWAITVLNLLRCTVQIAQTGASHIVLWNLLWLLARFGMILLEVSVVVFLLQGYVTTGREALWRTLVMSGAAASAETAVKVVYIFALHIPLFLFGGTSDDAAADMRWSKWSFWLLHALAAVIIYTAILVLPLTRWRDILPAKPSFYRYARCLLLLYLLMAVGAILIGSKVLSGYCLYGIANWLYYAVYPPLLYYTFLAEFFSDERLDLDLMYYSEMRDAGCFEEDSY
eukprot:jgi/Chrzof1/669/Cz01g24150.t1